MSSIRHIATGAIIQQVFSFVILILLTRSLGADGYGQIVTFLAITTTIFSISTQWATPFIVRTESIDYSNTSKIGKAFFIPFSISFMLLLSAWLFIIYDPLKKFDNLSSIPKLTLLGFSIGYFTYQVAKTSYQIQKNFKLYGLMMSFDKIILLLAIAGLYFSNKLSLNYVLWAYTLSTIMVGISCFLHSIFKKVNIKNSSFYYKDYFKSSSSVAISVVIFYFSSQPFVILVSQDLGNAHLAGWLGIGYVMSGVLLQPFMWIAPTLLPRFSIKIHQDNANSLIRNYFKNTVLPTTMLLLWCVVGVIFTLIFIPELLFLLGNGFQGGEIIISLVLLLTIPEAINVLLIQILYAKKQERLVILMVTIKVIPFIIGYILKQSMQIELVLLNLGGWISIGATLFFIGNNLKYSYFLKFIVISIFSFLIAYTLLFPQSNKLIIFILIGLTSSLLFYCREITNRLMYKN